MKSIFNRFGQKGISTASGFTLIELIGAVATTGVLIALLLPAVQR